MKAMGTEIGTIHFVGIGGIGMSGIAEVMHHLGYKVQGSDNNDSYVTEGLRKRGIPVMIGQDADNLGDAAVVVCSTGRKCWQSSCGCNRPSRWPALTARPPRHR